jgi:hypothetical protein
MVESSFRFVKINHRELYEKIIPLISHKSRIVFWKNHPKYFEGKLLSINDEESNIEKMVIQIDHLITKLNLIDKNLCFHLAHDLGDLYFKGKVLEHNFNEDKMLVEISNEIYKFEQRRFDRKNVGPFAEAFIYLKYSLLAPKNVLNFHGGKNQELEVLSKLNQKKRQGFTKVGINLENNDEEEVLGLKVDEMSKNGLSFLVTKREKEIIFSQFQNGEFEFVLSINQSIISIEKAKIKYIIDYLHPDFQGVTMYKVGIHFDDNETIHHLWQILFDGKKEESDHQKQFEEFIKNEV